MKRPFRTPFFAIFGNEVLLNSRRVAPYVLMLFSVLNAVLWSAGLGATYYGQEVIAKYGRLWATNSDYYITHNFVGFAVGIFGLPVFAALIMAEPVRRDFRLEIDGLIFSKPVSRAHYLLGKFFGSFFVLVCCQASFALTLILFQVFHTSQMVVLPFRLLPYFKHFIMIVVITYLLFAAIYFTVGTLTRSPKIVYVLAIAYYPLMFFYGLVFLKPLPPRWRVLLSPLMLREVQVQTSGQNPDWVDQLVVSYTPIMFANRALVILAAAVCLTIVYLRFRITEPPARTAVPSVTSSNAGLRAYLAKFAGNPLHTPFATVFQNEVLLQSKRVAPYALMILFTANAVLWWYRGPAVLLGWASNSDFYIARCLVAFSFLLGLPIFNAVIMGDPVIRDFRTGVDPLIFSKPVTRAQYLLGKFFGTFFVLVCCQAVFPLTQMVLQAFPSSQMVLQPFRVLPFFKHFFFFLVITHLTLAAFYFAVGTLTRNGKIVYGFALCFYPLYISTMVFLLSGLTVRGRNFLDPFQLNFGPSRNGFGHSAEFLNQYVVSYTADKIGNRALMLLAAGLCLAILYTRFTISKRQRKIEKFSVLSLSNAAETVSFDMDSFQEARGLIAKADSPATEFLSAISLPEVVQINDGIKFNLKKLGAAVGVELRLLLSERSLQVIMPLVIVISTLEVMFWSVAPDPSYSAAYAVNTAKSVLVFLVGVPIFYLGEAIHRDSDLRIEELVWSQPIPNFVLLLAKFLSTWLLTSGLIVSIGLVALAVQVLKGNTPLELLAYVKVYSLVLIPNAIFMGAVSLALHVLIRSRHVAYAIAISISTGLSYLYSQGHNHWLYNPLLHQLWSYSDLVARPILQQRAFVLALALSFISIAHLAYRRRSAGRHSHRTVDTLPN